LCEFGILGIAFSYDFFTLFVFWEIMAITSYFLITFGGQTDELEALKYIFISTTGSTILLFSLALIFGQTNSLNFIDVASFIRNHQVPLVKFIFVLSIICFAIKSGIVPFHTWVPDTYQEAYTPTTALFSSVLSKVGLFALLRILFIFFPLRSFFQMILMILAFFTMFLGNILALFEQNFKRLLAFSSIAQIGYALFAISIFTLDSVTAGLLHMINHAIVQAMMFFIAGICIYETRKKKLNEMKGVGRINKILGFAIIVGTFTLIGIPTFNIFVSELLIVLAGVEADYLIPTGLFLFNIFLSLFFYIRILRELILRRYSKRRTMRIPLGMQITILLLAILCILLGLYPWIPIEFCRMIAASLFQEGL
jgi:proton-translocating NADH-quinone oxidoreductase chain N